MVILYDRFNLPNNIFEIIFATEQQAVVAKLLIDMLRKNHGEVGRELMSFFATKLHDGKFVIDAHDDRLKSLNLPSGKKTVISYNKRQFYDRILTPMKGMGLIEFNVYKKVYRLSNNFLKDLNEISKLWQIELMKKK